jgi:hypothetical protein
MPTPASRSGRVVLDPPPRLRKVPADLVGLCFNCFIEDNIACDCPNPSCCFRYREHGHQAQDCRQHRAAPFGHSTGRVGRSLGRGSHRGRQVEPCRASPDHVVVLAVADQDSRRGHSCPRNIIQHPRWSCRPLKTGRYRRRLPPIARHRGSLALRTMVLVRRPSI